MLTTYAKSGQKTYSKSWQTTYANPWQKKKVWQLAEMYSVTTQRSVL